MRFASLGGSNAGNYAAAGKAVADSAAKMFAVQRKTGPDYAGLSKVAMKTASDEKIAGMQAEAKLTNVAQKVYADQTKNAYRIKVFETREDIKTKQRKAGGLAALGKIAGAGFLAATDNTKGRERPKSELSGLLESYKSDMAGLKGRQQDEFDALGPYKPTKSGTTTGTSTGKVTEGTETKPLGSSLSGNQKTVADAIAKYESGDWGYEAFNQGGSEGGTKVLGKSGSYKNTYGSSLTDMTLGQIYHKQNTKQRGLSMQEHLDSGGLHAVGRYQFIGSTLQDEARRMGLSDDTKFTPQVQDQIFLNHIKRVGNISPWVGPSNNYSSAQKQEFNSMIAGF